MHRTTIHVNHTQPIPHYNAPLPPYPSHALLSLIKPPYINLVIHKTLFAVQKQALLLLEWFLQPHGTSQNYIYMSTTRGLYPTTPPTPYPSHALAVCGTREVQLVPARLDMSMLVTSELGSYQVGLHVQRRVYP